MSRGVLIIISAPSGTGKSTICRELLKRRDDLRCSISCTTRSPRQGEKDGRDYFFIDIEEFKRRIARHEFLEWALVHGQYYGTPRHFIDTASKAGHNVLLAIDIQGAQSILRKKLDSILIFLAPPSMESLKERLAARRDDKNSIAVRLANSRDEMAGARKFHYYVVNDNLKKAVAQIECILTAEDLRTSRRTALELAAA